MFKKTRLAVAAFVLVFLTPATSLIAAGYNDGKVCNKACIKDINDSFKHGKVSTKDAKTLGTFTVVEMKTEKGAKRAVGINVDTNEMFVMQLTPIHADNQGQVAPIKGSVRDKVKKLRLSRTFSIADGFKHSAKDKDVYVFIDPNCPFCHQLINSILKRSYRGYAFHIIPVKALRNTTSAEVSYAIEHDLNALMNNDFKKGAYATAEANYNYSAYVALTQILGKSGVPLIVTEDGRTEIGFGSSSELKRFLKQKNNP